MMSFLRLACIFLTTTYLSCIYAKAPISCYAAVAALHDSDTRNAYRQGPDFSNNIATLKKEAPGLYPPFNEIAQLLSAPTQDNYTIGLSAGKAAEAMLVDREKRAAKNRPGHTLNAKLAQTNAQWERATNKQISSLEEWENLQYRSSFSTAGNKIELKQNTGPKIEVYKKANDFYLKFGNMPELLIDSKAPSNSNAAILRETLLSDFSTQADKPDSPLQLPKGESAYVARMNLHQNVFAFLKERLNVPEEKAISPESDKAFSAAYYSLRALEAAHKAQKTVQLNPNEGDNPTPINRWSTTAGGLNHLMTNEMFNLISQSAIIYNRP
jgi:hypothetical protein